MEAIERFKAEYGWEEVEDMDEFFTFENVGDCVYGTYINKGTNVGRNKATVYTLKNGDVEHKIFGTVAINKKMEDTPLNWEIAIIYQGEKPSAPPKKPYKMFRIFRRNPDKQETDKNPLADVEAVKIIDSLVDDLMDKHVDPTEEQILKLAKKYHIQDKETLPAAMLPRIEQELKRRG